MGKFLEENLIDSMDEKSKGTILRSMAIFTAIELCGSFLTGKVGPNTTKTNFITFCKSNYVPTKYRKISELLYSIFRNGVAHSYIPKGSAHLTSDPKAKSCHLQFFDSGLCIYVPELAKDITEAVRKLIKDLKKDTGLKNRYLKIFCQLDKMGKQKYQEYIKEKNITTKSGTFVGDISIDIE